MGETGVECSFFISKILYMERYVNTEQERLGG